MIKDFFKKDINRPIETVIKADDKDNIATEVAEYVITNEIAIKIRDFFSAYNNYTNVNGVWISGFFGSGKSHLLKILSYILENKAYDGYNVGELFAEKVEDDAMLKADIIKATRTPSESILFNIDQQSQITSKNDANAILSVFYKVFYDHLGFYGFQPHVAEFEMWLDNQNQYKDFVQKFKEEYNIPWQDARRDYFDPQVIDTIAQVLGDINNTEAIKYNNILEEIEDKHKQSIEDFCNRVNQYIESQPKGFRLNFFVDEIGQYISDNTKLMLNLQTIAENLATKSKGNAWILVTSQGDMEAVVGDMNKQQQNDFSRIKARFGIKISLTSANVDEVIEKRLLDKTEEINSTLKEQYIKQEARLKSLLSFSEVGVQFKGYQDEQDFANKFPFVPYQFDLFQQARIELSTHNAFQGKHASVGERSMLSVFQHVVKKIQERGQNTLVSFDLMFEGIRNELKSDIQNSITLAERNLDNDFELRVLKCLFLVKYFNNFKTTKRNISVLLLDDININLKEHDKKIEEALNTLENQSYIQRNGDIYEFLTNEEKDIEQEIKNTEIDDSAITNLLKEILFDEIIRDNRFLYTQNKQSYEFTSKINGVAFGRGKELGIEIITDDYLNNETDLQAQTMGSSVMKVLLSPPATFMRDVRMYLKTAKYEKQNRSMSTNPNVMRILQEKSIQNVSRKKNLIQQADNVLSQAKVFVNGSKLELNATADGKTKVVNAFQHLISSVYTNLRMLKSISYLEDSIKVTISNKQSELFKTDNSIISEAETEILNLINRRKQQGDRSSLADIKNEFIKRPYGWYPNAIWTLVAQLYKRGKIELLQNANTLENNDVLEALLNSAQYANTLLELQSNFNNADINRLKIVYKDAFDGTCSAIEAKEVATDFKKKLEEMSVEVNQLLAQRYKYSFIEQLQPFSEQINKWVHKNYSFFLTNISEFEDDLLDNKENLLDPIKRFVKGEQSKIYDDVKKLLDGNTANLSYIEGEELNTLKTYVQSKTPYKGNATQLAKAAKDQLSEKVLSLINDEKQKAQTKAQELITEIEQREDFKQLSSNLQMEVLYSLQNKNNDIQNERYIANIRQTAQQLDELHTNALNRIQDLLEKQTSNSNNVTEPKPKTNYIRKQNIHISFDKKELATENDVLNYIEALKAEYLRRIKDNTRITL